MFNCILPGSEHVRKGNAVYDAVLKQGRHTSFLDGAFVLGQKGGAQRLVMVKSYSWSDSRELVITTQVCCIKLVMQPQKFRDELFVDKSFPLDASGLIVLCTVSGW